MSELSNNLAENSKSQSDAFIQDGEAMISLTLLIGSDKGSESIKTEKIIEREQLSDELTGIFSQFIERGLIEKSKINSKPVRRRAGRKPLILNTKTGKVIGTMKSPNKEIVENWNDGKDVPQIATILRPKLKLLRRQNFITKIRRILLNNPKLLLRPYSQEIEFSG